VQFGICRACCTATRLTDAEARGWKSRPRAVSKRSLSLFDHKRASLSPRAMERGAQTVKLRLMRIFARKGPPDAREVTMSELGPTTIFGPMAWPQAQALAQFHSEPQLDVRGAIQGPDADKPAFAKRTEPAHAAPTELSFGPFRLLPRLFLLLEGGKPVPLGSRALEILIVLLQRPGELVSKQELMACVWPNVFVEPANLTVHISALRRVLRDGRDGNRFIINIPGRGYCFVASVAVVGGLKPDGIETRNALREQF
jgi:DNA-binding winged helix-turn-helix (wHTH) protein